MRQREEQYWRDKCDELELRYEHLRKNWQQLLVKEVERDKHILEQDKVIVALQNRLKLTQQLSPGDTTTSINTTV